jgi:exopolysaccharide/PEP-CTERM locus tyrosine autokinase
LGESVSIIEKAAGRLDRKKVELPPATDLDNPLNSPLNSPLNQPFEHPDDHAFERTEVAEPTMAYAQPRETYGQPREAFAQPHDVIPDIRQPSGQPSRRVEINLEQLHRLGMVTPEGGRTPIAEEFRMIKRPLIKHALAKGGGTSRHNNLIMVTSALPGEGKTFCAINLAMSIAMEMDHTVLLVDADVARPSVPRYLGIEAGEGLMDVLLNDKLDLSDVMLRTNVDTLRVLPAGQSHKNSTELLASLSMSNLLDDIARRYPDRIVIFDSPPLLMTTEAKVLASHMGQVIVVVEAETTTQHAVKDALRQLGTDNNVSLVYNKTKAFSGNNYGYGYN